MLLDVTHPVPDVGERGVVSDVVHQQNTHRAAVVCCARLPVGDMALGSLVCGGAAGGAPLVMVRKRSCPAVSQICSFTHLFSSRIFFILKSMLRTGRAQRHAPPQGCKVRRTARRAPPRRAHPIVVMKLDVNESSLKRSSRQLFPTPARLDKAGLCPWTAAAAPPWRRAVVARQTAPGHMRHRGAPLSPMSSSLMR